MSAAGILAFQEKVKGLLHILLPHKGEGKELVPQRLAVSGTRFQMGNDFAHGRGDVRVNLKGVEVSLLLALHA